MLGGVLFQFFNLRCVAAVSLAHARVNGMTCPRQGTRGQGTDATRRPGDYNDVLHCFVPLNSNPRRRENSGKAPVGTQNLAVDPSTIGTCKE